MEASVVYFTDLRSTNERNVFDKIDDLCGRLSLGTTFSKGNLVAVKLHFGEKGSTAYIRPQFVRKVVDMVSESGARPFLTDTNTLYVGRRTNTVSHIECAVLNGFDFSVVGAPVVIADGLRGESKKKVAIDGVNIKEASIAREVLSADGLFVLSHFKCHELTGFGGAIKNLGMGCASREGKLIQHANCPPVVEPEKCTACGECVLYCPVDAIEMGNVAFINESLCTGCSFCIAVCPEETIKVQWSSNAALVSEKMAEYAAAALKGKREKSLFINFITDVSPLCDCYGHTDVPIVRDIGIAASTDPVALDQACADMVNAEPGLEHTALKDGFEKGGDKFRGVHPDIDWSVQLSHAERMGIGKRKYHIEEL